MNKLLLRQMQKFIGNPSQIPARFTALFNAISECYDHYEKNLEILERSLEISSKELIELNNKLKSDICERENTERELKIVHNELKLLFENIDEILFSFDVVNNKITQISSASEKIYGYKPEEFYENHDLWKQVVHPQDKYISEKQFKRLIGGNKITTQYRIIHKNGNIRWIENRIIPTIDDAGVLIRVDGITSDITEKIEREQKLRENELKLIENEKKYRILFENNPMPMWVISPHTFKFMNVNDAAIKHYGYSREEFLAMSVPDIKLEADKVSFLTFMRQTEIKRTNIRTRHVKKNGTVVNVDVSVDSINLEGEQALIVLSNDVTERIKAEQKLKISNERYELVTRATSDAIWDWNLGTNELYWSEAYEKLFGYRILNEESNVNSWINRVHPDDLEKVTKGIMHAINNSHTNYWEEEYRYIRADGSVAYIYDRGFVIYDEHKMPVRMVGAMQDISKRKKTEEHLQKSEANLRNILENTDTGYILLDENGKVLSFNKVANDLAKEELSETLEEGRDYISLMPEVRKTEVELAIKNVLSAVSPIHYEVLYDRHDGNSIWLHISMYPILNHNKKILGLSVVTTDITKRKSAEQMLLKSEANLRTIFDNTDVSYVLLDKKFNIISFNNSAAASYAKQLNVKLTEGKNFFDYLPEEHKLATKSKYELVLQGKKVKYEVNFQKADGMYEWYCMNAFPVYDDLSNILGIIIAGEDITGRKLAELEREKITSDLMERNTTLEQFAYIISHNLRSPVANITGLSNLILNSKSLDKKDFNKCMEGLALSVKKLDEIIIDLNHILQVRRKINEKKEAVKFSGLIKDIKTSISNLIEKENILIKTNFINVNEVFAIKSYLNSIFYNLISNSIKYRNPSLNPVIEIKSRLVNNKVQLIFKDNGLGIDLNKNDGKIFGLYKKFHSHVEGKGMGLYMVKTQVEILGGTIDVRSEVNKGTEFLIELNV